MRVLKVGVQSSVNCCAVRQEDERQHSQERVARVEKRYAVVFTCSDPRLREAARAIDVQIMEHLGVSGIIPLSAPGMIGLYADRSILDLPSIEKLKGDLFDKECQRRALERGLAAHIPFHNPCAVVIFGHDDCKGYPSQDQAGSARVGAEVLRHRLRARAAFDGPVYPATLDLCPSPGWRVRML